MRWKMTIAALLGLLLAVAGCSAAADSNAAHGEADVAFSTDMIRHHQQTIDLAEAAQGRATSAYVRELSARLPARERADITMMESWLRSWGEPVPMGAPAKVDLPGEGPDFDRAWLTALSEHLHHGLLMAETVRKSGRHGPTLELAEKIIREQGVTQQKIAEQLA
ncbi:DUF305 domain-containing protein [Nonomuraea candida]|uniref:DUF305 domain-containing protein n=1 Tax=Nonomuraea candida TaxID=359159 RepID=UPI00146FE475|nr:DUF305 domain-containing protein [Nonomuraea candida]